MGAARIPEIHIYTGNTQIYRTLPIDLQVGVYSTSKLLHYQIPNMYWIHNKAQKKPFQFLIKYMNTVN